MSTTNSFVHTEARGQNATNILTKIEVMKQNLEEKGDRIGLLSGRGRCLAGQSISRLQDKLEDVKTKDTLDTYRTFAIADQNTNFTLQGKLAELEETAQGAFKNRV